MKDIKTKANSKTPFTQKPDWAVTGVNLDIASQKHKSAHPEAK